MFRMLVHSSSGACDCVWVYCSGSMCVGVTVWFGWGDVVSLCRLKLCFSLHKDQHQHTSNHSSIPTHSRKLLKINVLAFETCWARNKASDISWSIFIQLTKYVILWSALKFIIYPGNLKVIKIKTEAVLVAIVAFDLEINAEQISININKYINIYIHIYSRIRRMLTAVFVCTKFSPLCNSKCSLLK